MSIIDLYSTKLQKASHVLHTSVHGKWKVFSTFLKLSLQHIICSSFDKEFYRYIIPPATEKDHMAKSAEKASHDEWQIGDTGDQQDTAQQILDELPVVLNHHVKHDNLSLPPLPETASYSGILETENMNLFMRRPCQSSASIKLILFSTQTAQRATATHGVKNGGAAVVTRQSQRWSTPLVVMAV